MRSNTSEETILKKLKAGTKKEIDDAFRLLYSKKWKGLARKAVLSTGGRESEVEDVFHDSLIILAKNVLADKFEGNSKLSTYFYGICRLRYLRYYSKTEIIDINKLKSQKTDLNLQDLLLGEIRNKELKGLIDKVINALGQPCSSILFYRKLGVSFVEIANELNYTNPDSVRNQAARCRKKMRDYLISNEELLNKIKKLR